jgi:hypothetical protein
MAYDDGSDLFPTAPEILVAGGFGTSRTTFEGAVSHILPLTGYGGDAHPGGNFESWKRSGSEASTVFDLEYLVGEHPEACPAWTSAQGPCCALPVIRAISRCRPLVRRPTIQRRAMLEVNCAEPDPSREQVRDHPPECGIVSVRVRPGDSLVRRVSGRGAAW